MVQVILAGQALGRPAKPVNSVSVAACALLLWNPWQFWDLGWRLSVVAALTLAALADLRGLKGVLVSGPSSCDRDPTRSSRPLFGTVPVVGTRAESRRDPGVFRVIFPLISVLAVPGVCGAFQAAPSLRRSANWFCRFVDCFAETTASFIPGRFRGAFSWGGGRRSSFSLSWQGNGSFRPAESLHGGSRRIRGF
jgi:hypothetical protein